MALNKAERHKEICSELNELYIAKNNDYGDSFAKIFSEFGEMSAYVRMSDKLYRLITLSKKAQKVNDESKIDSLRDLANYAVMTIIEIENADK